MSKSSRLNALAELKRVRQGGKRTLKEQDATLYDQVTEDQYASIVKGRLERDDFVEDDGVDGYLDNGMDDWLDEEQPEDQDAAPKKHKKKSKPKPKVPPPPPPAMSDYRPAISEEKESEFMASLLGELDSAVPAPVISKKRKIEYDPVTPPPSSDFDSPPPPSDDYSSPIKRPKVEKEEEWDIQMDDAFDDSMLVDDPPPQPEPEVPQQEKLQSWQSVMDTLQTSTFNPEPSSSALPEPDTGDTLKFYWIDYLEHQGKLYLIGKVASNASYVSACLTIENLQRNLFVLPAPDAEDTQVFMSFDEIRKNAEVQQGFKAKFVNRTYVFGGADADVPRGETRWLKVFYPFSEPPIPGNAKSSHIARIFGTNTSAFEMFVVKRKIMGPCWLQVKGANCEHKGMSWTKQEYTVSNPKHVTPIAEGTIPHPPLNVMSLSIRTIVNHRENKQEVVSASSRVWNAMQIDTPTPPSNLPCITQTFVRPLDKFPKDFDKKIHDEKNKSRGITPTQNERMLLNSLLVSIYKNDPDIIIGHDLLGPGLEVLLNRMKDLKADHWSRIGRFRRSAWPQIGKSGQGYLWRFCAGRLVCDLASDAAKSMISSTTWSLSEMCKTHLGIEREDIDPDDTASYLDGSLANPTKMLVFLKHCEADAYFQMAIAMKVQILGLTRQLTGLAGNGWNRTLNGGRAERNEYILLHEFHRLKYICPDKAYGSRYKQKEESNDEGKKGKKDKYKGGLVFEPKRGLWDKYILVMDFNSLYPSIIQEYNIDFTTVERVDGVDENGEDIQPDPPGPEVPQGVLPRLIATLVQRRRQVKSLLKDKTASPAQLLQWDIKQQALKLTANSMYGCLGFEYSRFYARELAALTTFKGREILTHTRELAESLSLDVVYGDTDSVFVNSNVTELSDALKISASLKKAVNDRYKLLEIDLDGVFQRLLLLQKKKYAALKVEDGKRTTMEVKGLDMKRREYCALSKTVSQYVLDRILSDESAETVVEMIHEYLSTIGENVRAGKMNLDDFIIFKRLGKNPEDYPKVEGQPHVQVALKMKAKGGNAKAGDVIPYVFCLASGEETARSAQADRARHPDEVRKAGSELKIDYEFYLSQQILPPIERLCDPINGTDRARLADCLGLDPAKYRVSSSGGHGELSFASLDSQLSDTERYKDAVPFIVICRHCGVQTSFAPLNERENSLVQASGPQCTACHKVLGTPSLQTQLEVQIREQISKYYEAWLVCDDPTCGKRTRMMSVYGRRCLQKGCRGTVAFEYSDSKLYTQLRYFAFLFNAQKAVKTATGSEHQEAVSALVQQNAKFLNTMTECVEKYLDQCGRRWVEMSRIFSFMKL